MGGFSHALQESRSRTGAFVMYRLSQLQNNEVWQIHGIEVHIHADSKANDLPLSACHGILNVTYTIATTCGADGL